MITYPKPTCEGHWWAKLLRPRDMPVGEDWRSSDWEVVQVVDNNADLGDPDEYIVLVPGVSPSQWLEDFEWGPAVGPCPALYHQRRGE